MTIDRSVEEPCEVTSLTHGFEAERRGRPLRLGSALYERLQAFGLPVECGSGGLTKYNRTLRGLPQAHWTDAACVGRSTPERVNIAAVSPLVITAQGHGCRQLKNVDRFGFPRGKPKQRGHSSGFKTGDLVRAVVPSGKKTGTYLGRIAIRSTGSFNITTTHGTIQGISHRHCAILHRADGYEYTQAEKGGAFPPAP